MGLLELELAEAMQLLAMRALEQGLTLEEISECFAHALAEAKRNSVEAD
jgi:alkylhydroperoxidase/carboxymuconolactone decarboxylase family protein YurZ